MKDKKFQFLHDMPAFLGLLTALLIFFLLIRTPQDADMWWHLRAGHDMWLSKSILLTDQFSFTRMGQSWVNAFWVSDAAMYLVFRLGGFLGISLLVASVGAVTFYLLYQRTSRGGFISAFIMLLAALTAAPVWGPRPQIFSFLMLAVLDGWMERTQQSNTKVLWPLIPFFALWANIHGGWIWGFLLLAAYISGDVINNIVAAPKQTVNVWKYPGALALWTLGAMLAIGVNPNGIGIWRLPFHTVDVSLQIQEWASPDFHQLQLQPLLWMVFLLLIFAVAAKPKTNWIELIKVTGFAYLVFFSQRNVAPFAIIAAPTLANWVYQAARGTDLRYAKGIIAKLVNPTFQNPKAFLNVSILVVLLSTALGRAYVATTPNNVRKGVPYEAVQWVKRNPPKGHLFNSYNWGGYLEWVLPQTPVFIDGRADLFGKDIISQWWAVAQGTPGGFSALDQWQVQMIILEPSWPIVKLLPASNWHEVYRDGKAVVFVRDK